MVNIIYIDGQSESHELKHVAAFCEPLVWAKYSFMTNILNIWPLIGLLIILRDVLFPALACENRWYFPEVQSNGENLAVSCPELVLHIVNNCTVSDHFQ